MTYGPDLYIEVSICKHLYIQLREKHVEDNLDVPCLPFSLLVNSSTGVDIGMDLTTHS